MGKSTEEKLFRYIKAGKLHRVRSLFKKYKPSYLTTIVDCKGRSALHASCLLGNDAIMRLLLKNGADVEVKDSDGNTPLHFALKYATETSRISAFNDLIVPLLNLCSRQVLDMKNSDGKTARECLSQLKRAYYQRREEAEDLRKRQWRTETKEMSKQEEELEWQRKLQFEAGQEDFCKYSEEDYHGSAHESYDEWVERMVHERRQKKASSERKQRKEAERKRYEKQEEARKRTKELEQEHEAYMTRMSIERQKLKLAASQTEYETQCQIVFDSGSRTDLKFIDIPWPGELGDATEMINLIVKWSEMISEEEGRKKFLKEQQVRWHPDKFLQKCGNRLYTGDKERIIEQVKKLSQEINSLLD